MTFLTKENHEKVKILDVLTKESDPLPIEFLAEKTKLNLTSYTTNKHLLDLTEQIEKLYPEDKVSLKMTNQTVLLTKSGINLSLLFENIYKSDMFYQIIFPLLQEEYISVVDFSYQAGISISTLRRYVKEINCQLMPYRLHITLAQRMTLTGTKADRIFFTFSFLFRIHHQFFKVSVTKDSNNYVSLTRKIFSYLNLETDDPFLIEKFSFLTFAVSQQEHFKKSKPLNSEQEQIFLAFDIKEKPSFLLEWSQKDWLTFLVTLLALEEFPNYSLHDMLTNNEHFALLEETTQEYVLAYKRYFCSLSSKETEHVKSNLVSYKVLSLLYPLTEETTQGLISFSRQNFSKMYPRYVRRFNKFWLDFTRPLTDSCLIIDYFFIRFLLLSLSHCPNHQLLPEVKVYIQSDQPTLYNNYLKTRLAETLSPVAKLSFTPYSKEAELTLSLLPADHIPNNSEHLVYLNAPLQEKDFSYLTQYIRQAFPNLVYS